MIFTETPLAGAFQIDIEPRQDERGFFARTFCRDEFTAHGLDPDVAQCNMSFNVHAGTLRGMHYQHDPHGEAKLVRCTRGGIWDAIIDLRAGSPTCRRWFGVDLTAENRRMLYVPVGFAHGFQTRVPDTEIAYQVSESYAPGSEGGLRWDDPDLGIDWPEAPERVISGKDRSWPLVAEAGWPEPTGGRPQG